jgi:signal transduction histidine kinase
MSLPLHILLVEDSEDDAELLVIELERSGYQLINKKIKSSKDIFVEQNVNRVNSEISANFLTSTSTEQWFLTHIQNLNLAIQYLSHAHCDVVLLDLSLPDSQGLDTVKRLQANTPNIPVIVLTGMYDRKLALQAVAGGAQDYLVKGQISAPLLERALQYAIERKKSEVHLKLVLEQERELNQIKLIHREKLANLGQLIASVAHEINNPVTFISANLHFVDEYVQDLLNLIRIYQHHSNFTAPNVQDEIEAMDFNFIQEDLPKMISAMRVGAERICELVLTLRNFSRLEQAEMQSVNLHEGIESSLLILRDRLKEKSGHPAIEIIRDYGDLPPVEGYAGQLNQVFLNIFSNSIDALREFNTNGSNEVINNYSPTITIQTRILDSDRVLISIKDNGIGITDSVKTEVFNPFFTTKAVGEGTGLGLSISHQIIVETHKGQLECISAPGQGAEFRIEIPIEQQGQKEEGSLNQKNSPP